VKRKIIRIDEDKCNGCGLCIPGCPEAALQIVDTPKGKKARLVKEIFCDGLGACLGKCPQGAISIEERDAAPYNEEETIEWIKKNAPERLEEHLRHLKEHAQELPQFHQHKVMGGCPGAREISWEDKGEATETERAAREDIPSQLRQWPVQITLVSPHAPYFKNAHILICADCVPFAYANFHRDFLKGKTVLVGCPKLDDLEAYIEKFTQVFSVASPQRVTVLHMEVPCCFGLVYGVKEALKRSGKDIPFEEITISIDGKVI